MSDEKKQLARKRELQHKETCPATDWDADPDSCNCGVTKIYDEVNSAQPEASPEPQAREQAKFWFDMHPMDEAKTYFRIDLPPKAVEHLITLLAQHAAAQNAALNAPTVCGHAAKFIYLPDEDGYVCAMCEVERLRQERDERPTKLAYDCAKETCDEIGQLFGLDINDTSRFMGDELAAEVHKLQQRAEAAESRLRAREEEIARLQAQVQTLLNQQANAAHDAMAKQIP